MIAVSGTEVRRIVVPPITTPFDPEVTGTRSFRIIARTVLVVVFLVPVPAPFPHVAVHVVKAEGIRSFLPDRVGVVARVPFAPGILAQLLEIVAERLLGRAAGTASVFPLRFGRQPVAVTAENGHLLAG